MRPLGLVMVVGGAALVGWLAWRRTTSTMYYRSANSSIRPPHIRPEDYEEWVIARRKRWRLAKAVGSALVGAALAWVLFTMADGALARR